MAVRYVADARKVSITLFDRFTVDDYDVFIEAYKDAKPNTTFWVDFGQVKEIDSASLGMLLLLREHAGGDDAQIILADCSASIRRLLLIANFQKRFAFQ